MTGRRRLSASIMMPAALLVAAVTLAGCTGSGDDSTDGGPRASSSPGSGGAAPAQEAAALGQQYLRNRRPAAIASVRGQVITGTGSKPSGTLDILSVSASAASTAVRARLSSDDSGVPVSTSAYKQLQHNNGDFSAVELLARQANLRLLPGTWSGSVPASDNCTCSKVPSELGPEGVEISIVYPALPPSVNEIQLQMPGFPKVTVPATRN